MMMATTVALNMGSYVDGKYTILTAVLSQILNLQSLY
jgi:hypothetical protein